MRGSVLSLLGEQYGPHLGKEAVKPIDFPMRNVIVAKDQPEYTPLPAYIDQESVTFVWQLSWKERLQVLISGRIWHTVLHFGRSLQPQKLQTRSPFNTGHLTRDN